MKVGIFGGTFNPPHLGHLNAMSTVLKKLDLKKLYVVPAWQNPLKSEIDGATPEQRLEMLKLAVTNWSEQLVLDDQEIKRGGNSYAIDTIREYRKVYTAEELHLVLGMDNLETISEWRDADEILKETNIIFASRPGYDFPQNVDELPSFIANKVADFDFNFIELKSGRNIQFLQLKDLDYSGSDIRKRMRQALPCTDILPLGVESYLKKNGIYAPLKQKISDYNTFAIFCKNQLLDKKAIAVRAFDLRTISAPCEYAVICSGTSSRHTAAIAEGLTYAVKKEFGLLPQSLEGTQEGRWVLVDYGFMMVHIFYDFIRKDYNLEGLWEGAKLIE